MENLEICKDCGGVCCAHMGCHYAPTDFKDLTYEGLKKEIDKGYISIDWWQNNPFDDERNISRALFLRVRNVKSNVVDPSWGGRCSLLTETGCSLSYDERPKGGRTLIPVKYGNCEIKYSKDECARDWYEYNEILLNLEKYYELQEKTSGEGYFDFTNLFTGMDEATQKDILKDVIKAFDESIKRNDGGK